MPLIPECSQPPSQVLTSYNQLVKAYGPPASGGDPCKSHAEWSITTPYGAVDLYDWKLGVDPTQWSELSVEWNVNGGLNAEAAEWIQSTLPPNANDLDAELHALMDGDT